MHKFDLLPASNLCVLFGKFGLIMSASVRVLIFLLALVFAFLGGGVVAYRLFSPKLPEKPREEATVLLESIQEVFKLTTVEGEFSEIYTYEEYRGSLRWLWDKKAIIRVQATVAAGYDLKNITFKADSSARVVRIGPLPKPQILSIDHTVDYYDVSTGIFESFSPEDLTWINQQAKKKILEKAQESYLLKKAEEQSNKVFDLLRFAAEAAGWRLEVIRESDKEPMKQ